MPRWGKGWEVGLRKAIHQYERSQKIASEILKSEHGVRHKPGERKDACELCQTVEDPDAKKPRGQ